MAPVVILGGIYPGFFTFTEAAIVSIFYTLFVGISYPYGFPGHGGIGLTLVHGAGTLPSGKAACPAPCKPAARPL